MYGSKIFEYMSMKIKLIVLHVFEQKQQQERSSNNFGSLWFVAHTVDFYIWKKVQRRTPKTRFKDFYGQTPFGP